MIANGKQGFKLEEATVRFGASAVALESVSLSITRGDRVALVGPSGAGKTTLLRLLNAIIRPTSGRVTIEAQDISRLPLRSLRLLRAEIGFVHQDLSLVPNLRVIQNVLTGRLGHQSLMRSLASILFTRRAEAAEAHRILERVGIEEKLYERTDRLSGGEQQRVAIARALYQKPVALLADEPVASVDPARARDTVALLNDIAKEGALTLVMSLHNLELAREFFPRLIGLREGRVAFDAPTDEISDDQFRELYRIKPRAPREGATP